MADVSCVDVSRDWVVLRDRERSVCCQAVDHWDRMLLLAVLSADPRSMEELCEAWLRYRPQQPLMSLPWLDWTDASMAMIELPDDTQTNWLWIDMTRTQYAWHDCDDPDDSLFQSGTYRRYEQVDHENNELLWLNIPPWWTKVNAHNLGELLDSRCEIVRNAETAVGSVGGTLGGGAKATVVTRPLDYRAVLFGRELVADIARQLLAIQCTATPPITATEGGESQVLHNLNSESQDDTELDDTEPDSAGLHSAALDNDPDNRAQALIKRVHVKWLMTPRASLQGRTPREFLHEHRDWKDRELDYRRSHWSRSRVPPPAVPRDSHQFRFGPMGVEEVVIYFDMCRELIIAAWRWIDDEPSITADRLIDDLLMFQSGWMQSEDESGSGMSNREAIDGERQLMPHLASDEPLDCDCPLCRLQKSDSHLFGPAFSICDGYHLEMEGDFAFSLETDRDMWELVSDQFDNCADHSAEHSADSNKDDSQSKSVISAVGGSEESADGVGQVSMAVGWPLNASGRMGTDDEAVDRELDSEVWKSSMVCSTINSPQLSLLAVGTRLTEMICELKRLGSQQLLIDQLNSAFDEMARVIREWLVSSAGSPTDDATQAMNRTVERMVGVLESVTAAEPELTARSADLQSLVHEWQRLLLSP